MRKAISWALCAVIAAAGLFTVIKLGMMMTRAPREPGSSVGIDFVSFARRYLFSPTAITIGVLIFAITFSIVSFVSRK